MYEDTRSALLGQTQVVFYLVDLLQDKNKEVGRLPVPMQPLQEEGTLGLDRVHKEGDAGAAG